MESGHLDCSLTVEVDIAAPLSDSRRLVGETPLMELIASIALTAVPATGDAFAFTIALHTPYCDDQGIWRCAATMEPLQKRLSPAAGADSLQAICLAIALVRSLLEAFQDDGGTFLEDGERWSLKGYPMGKFQDRY